MVGKQIHEIRKKKGLTLTEVAHRANISKSYLSNIERDLNQNPSIYIIKKLAMVLNVDVKVLLNPNFIEETSSNLEKEWIELINELKDSGVEKDQIHEIKTLIEYMKWKNDHVGEKK
ncbi:helix-turn-helix transcriptional regulator [Bacillus sp. MM2020_1]|nr:helix-turn-helix transcriptional regulator [Bacillus sp. MM2020_1]